MFDDNKLKIMMMMTVAAGVIAVVTFHLMRHHQQQQQQQQHHHLENQPTEDKATSLNQWLESRRLTHLSHVLEQLRIRNLDDLAEFDRWEEIRNEDSRLEIESALEKLSLDRNFALKREILETWLEINRLSHLRGILLENGIRSIADLAEFRDLSRIRCEDYIRSEIAAVIRDLPKDEDKLRDLENRILDQGTETLLLNMSSIFGGVVFLGCWLAYETGLFRRGGFFDPVRQCAAKIQWPPDSKVEDTKSVLVSFFDYRGNPIDITGLTRNRPNDGGSFFAAEARLDGRGVVNCFIAMAGEELHVLQIVFNARIAGRYSLTLKLKVNQASDTFSYPE